MNPVVVSVIQRYGFAIFSTMLATCLRIAMEPALGERNPFGLYFLSVLLTAGIAGTGPAIIALAGGILAAAHWVIPPSNSLWVPHAADQMALFVYGVVGAVAIVLFHRSAVEAVLLQQRASENEELSGKLRDADQRKDEFLALLSHELRNPLAPIRTGLALLEREDRLSPVGVEVRQAIQRQLDQLIRIVDDLLDVSRFLRGQLRMDRALIDLRDVVDLALNTVEPLVQTSQHDVKFLRPQQPVVVRGDEVRLTQVVANLLTNAVRYTPRNGRICVLLDAVDGEARIQVSDNGIGIPREVQDHIFDLFAQGNSSQTRDHGGLGLGLAIVRQILELHSGSVAVTSDGPGRGSCFTVTLPLAIQENVPQQSDENHAAEQDGQYPRAEKRIMIVDDNSDAAQTLATLLSYDGYSTQVANDGPMALNHFEEFSPDVVLLDIGMPGMDGYEVARLLRRRGCPHQYKIIAVTGWGQESDRVLSLNAGIDHHVVKPVDIKRLLDLIEGAADDPAKPMVRLS